MATPAISPLRADSFPEWYQQVIRASDLAEHAPVRGCMIVKPWGYAIWELVQRELDRRLKETGHQNCYFPLLVPMSLIAAEAEHIDGFAKEMAVVTHHRLVRDGTTLRPDGALDEPLVVRPTSEMIIGQAMARWVRSYRDLPVLLNQWSNVVRWEMRPRLFLRTSEFLWQEGHTAHETAEEASAETERMLEIYRQVVEEVMAIPVICGEKPESERFPGADRTLTIEAMMQDGKALQAGTSHFLGQRFARAAGIRFQDRSGETRYCWTTSWGVSTRLIGALIMTHGDDDGLRLPPMVAPHQIVVVPILRSADHRGAVLEAAHALAARLRSRSWGGAPIRCHVDAREIAAPDKRWEWIRKGVPVLCEVGPRDLRPGTVAFSTRHDRDAGRRSLPVDELIDAASGLLRDAHDTLWRQAVANRRARTRTDVRTRDDLWAFFGSEASDSARGGFVRAKWAEDPAGERELASLGVTVRCLPLDQSPEEGRCVLTGKPARLDAVLARAY